MVTKTTKNEVNIESKAEKQECSSTGRKTKLSNGEAKDLEQPRIFLKNKVGILTRKTYYKATVIKAKEESSMEQKRIQKCTYTYMIF